MAKEHIQKDCIRCGKCVRACPVKLQPVYLNKFSISNEFNEAEKLNALDCIECGCCSYICPSKRYLLPSIRVAKAEITEKRRKREGK
jgi:electron transport complex protein RnfC